MNDLQREPPRAAAGKPAIPLGSNATANSNPSVISGCAITNTSPRLPS
jgi:hypothetical protein